MGASNFLPASNWSPAGTPSPSGMRIVPLGAPISWYRLVLSHAVALLPAVLFLGALLYSSALALGICNLRLLVPGLDEEQCQPTMSWRVATLFVGIGGMSWHGAYAVRPVCWEVASFVANVVWTLPRTWIYGADSMDESAMVVAGVLSALLRSVLVETLRLVGHEVCVLCVLALATYGQAKVAVLDSSLDETCWVGVDDPRFPLSLWLGIGWAAAEVIAGSFQLVKFLPFYRTLDAPPPADEVFLPADVTGDDSAASSLDDDDRSLDEVILVREKSELEEQLGEYLENVSYATIVLWRLDSVLWNMGSALMLSASLTLAQGCLPDPSAPHSSFVFVPFPSLSTMWPTLVQLIALHTAATVIWMMALPRLGLVSVTYTTMLFGLGLLSLGLGRWGALA